MKGTGGGEYRGKNGNPIIEAVVNIINFKTVVGLQSDFDSDAIVLDVIPSEDLPVALDSSVPFQLSFDEIVPSTSKTINISAENVLRETEMQPGSLLSPTEPGPLSGARSSWSTYVPRKLKTKTSSKLRPTMLNPVVVAKEAYYKRKLELLEAAEARESCEQLNKAKRGEEHKKKCCY
ncbi:hypothetical protein MTP99_005822 [Tenebrio molitor]|nr:hypothetical protein MTP99_005822 [Tenebrio molitor]